MPAEGHAAAADSRTVSDVLAGLQFGGQTWCYCDLGADGGYSVPHGDAVLFHTVLHGSVRMALPSGGAIELKAGEAAAVLTGEAHALRASTSSAAAPLDFLKREQGGDAAPTFACGSAGPLATRMLSGRLTLALPGGASSSSLPSVLRLGTAAESAWGRLLRPESLPLAGIGPGSAALLTRIASLMIAAELRADPRCRQLFAPQSRDPIGQALRLIASNPSANWTVERLARSVGMGRSNFAAHFTRQVGRAPMEVVAEQRMEHAAQLLRKSKLKIAEISELSGYGSEAAFSRRFTRNFGISPSALREQSRSTEGAKEVETSWKPLLSGPRTKDAAARLRAPKQKVAAAGQPSSEPVRTTIFRGG